MHNSKTRFSRLLMTAILYSLIFHITPSFANDYYRWVGKDGVIHYGSRPPEGVEATKIKTGSGKAPATTSPKSSASNSPDAPEQTAEAQDLVAKRKEECALEKQRLRALQTPARRIKMAQPDGTVRFLTPQEVAREVANSKEFISQACG